MKEREVVLVSPTSGGKRAGALRGQSRLYGSTKGPLWKLLAQP